MTFIAGVMAHEESEHKSERVGIAFDRIKSNGGAIGRPGYGFRVVGETKYEKRFVPDSIESAVIREATDPLPRWRDDRRHMRRLRRSWRCLAEVEGPAWQALAREDPSRIAPVGLDRWP